MASYAELEAEPWWDREIVTSQLDWLGDELCWRTGQPRSSYGSKGNNSHLNGGHRSQEWIKNSEYCTNRTYTVQSGLSSEQLRHIAAADFVPGAWGTSNNRALMAEQTSRLFAAGRAGKLKGVTQIQGTLDGKVTAGINLPSGSTYRPDSSHLDHWHLTFDRRYMRDTALMQRILDVVLGGEDMSYVLVKGAPGVDPAGQDRVYLSDGITRRLVPDQQGLDDVRYLASTGQIPSLYENGAVQEVNNLAAYGIEVKPATTVELDPEDLQAIVDGVTTAVLEALENLPRGATEEEVRDAIADMAEGGVPEVRADADGNQ
jgi:hypothetical protein